MATWSPTGVMNQSQTPAKLQPNLFVSAIVELLPGGAHPLFAMSEYFKPVEKPVTQVEYGYWRETFMFVGMTNSGAKVAGDTSLTVNSTAGVVPGMLFQVPATRELIRVVTVPSGTTLTVARGQGRIAAGAIADTAVLFHVGNAQAEESTRPTARRFEATYTPNYTGIFRNAWAVSGTAEASAIALGIYTNVGRSREQCAKFHTLDWENLALYSQPVAPTGTPQYHATQGIIDSIYQYASSNVFTAGATTSFAQLLVWVNAAFATSNSVSNSSNRVALVDSTTMAVLQGIGASSTAPAQLWQDSGKTSYGTRYTSMYSIYGEVTFMEDKVLNGNKNAKGVMVIVDPEVLQVGYMPGRNNVPEEIQGFKDSHSSAIDATMGGLLTEMVVLNLVPTSCVVVNGITAAAA